MTREGGGMVGDKGGTWDGGVWVTMEGDGVVEEDALDTRP